MSNKPITRKEMFMAKASGQNVNTPKPITREEKFLEKIAENGGKANSWKDLGEKTVMGDTLTWDGNTDGLVTAMADGEIFSYKISNATPLMSDLSSVISTVEGVEAQHNMSELLDGFIADDGFVLFVIHENAVGVDVDGIIFPEAGIYFVPAVPCTLTINGYNGFERTEIVPIPEEYLPEADLVIRLNTAPGVKPTIDNVSIIKGSISNVKQMIKDQKCPSAAVRFTFNDNNYYVVDTTIKGNVSLYAGFLNIGYITNDLGTGFAVGYLSFSENGEFVSADVRNV